MFLASLLNLPPTSQPKHCLYIHTPRPCSLQALSYLTGDWTQAMAVKVPSPNHWITTSRASLRTVHLFSRLKLKQPKELGTTITPFYT